MSTFLEQLDGALHDPRLAAGDWSVATLVLRIATLPVRFGRDGMAGVALDVRILFGRALSCDDGQLTLRIEPGDDADVRRALAELDAVRAVGELELARVTRRTPAMPPAPAPPAPARIVGRLRSGEPVFEPEAPAA